MHIFTCSIRKHLASITFLFFISILTIQGQFSNRSGSDSTIYVSNTVFVPKSSYYTPAENWAITSLDIDKDGDKDLIVAPRQKEMLEIYYNDGKGKFPRQQSVPSISQIRSLTLIDANNDQHLDIAALSLSGKVVIHLNTSYGTLRKAHSFYSGKLAHHITAADVNGDQQEDLIISVMPKDVIHIHYGKGDGTFDTGISIPSGRMPRVSRVGDLDQDGHADIVVGCDENRLYIHYGKGKDQFDDPVLIRSGDANWALGLEDLNDDGLIDIIAGAYLTQQLCVHLNEGNRSFQREQCVSSGDHNFDLIIRDFDMDGDKDIVTCSTEDNAISIHLNQGDGIIGDANKIQSGIWNAAITEGDFDHDGDIDIAVASIKDHKIHVHLNISQDSIPQKVAPPCIKGTVFKDDTEVPYAGAVVNLQDAKGKTVATLPSTEEGTFKFCPQAERPYFLQVRTPDYPLHRDSIYFPPHDLIVDIHLLSPQQTFVYGQIRDANTQEILNEALVTIKDKSGSTITTLLVDKKGRYRYELPFGEQYEVSATSEGYFPMAERFDLLPIYYPNGLRKDLKLDKDELFNKKCVVGNITFDQEQEIPERIPMVIKDTFGQVIHKFLAKEDGHFEYYLEEGVYDVSVRVKGYFYEEQRIHVDQVHDKNNCLALTITLKALLPGAQFVLEDIYYDVDKATLRERSMLELDKLIQLLLDNPNLKVELSSHTDSDASDEYNMSLSQRRAQSVVDYLTTGGIDYQRTVPKGYGESLPLAPNNSPENKQLNRRTEFKILGYQ